MEPTIKHLVITGGGTVILNAYGALREAHKQGIWSHDSVNSYYGTSAGSILSFMLALNYSWETLDKYIINRPWKTLINFSSINIYECFVGNGMLDADFFYETFTPLMRGKDMDINITFSQFHALSGKELYCYALNLGSCKTEELSHKTYPDMRVIDGIYASSALPILFKPFKYRDIIFSDGGLYSNYPIAKCLEHGCDPKHVLGVRIRLKQIHIPENMGMLEYIGYIFNMVLTYTQDTAKPGPTDICLDVDYEDFSHMLKLVDSPEEREREIGKGVANARQWISSATDKCYDR
jgi:predicted acylesterase/phospholipase RssA